MEDNQACHEMKHGEILNSSKTLYPLYKATIYGSRVDSVKLSKRLSCAIKPLPIRVEFFYEYSTLKAIEKGIRKDLTLVLNEDIFIEGLIKAEEITKKFENYLLKALF